MKNKDRYNLSELTVSIDCLFGAPILRVYQGRDLKTRKEIATIRSYGDKHVDNILDWLEQDYSPLDEKEKEYLSSVIKPWRYRVKSIVKQERLLAELIIIKCKDGWEVELPNFEMGAMYQGMELNKEYRLGELGI